MATALRSNARLSLPRGDVAVPASPLGSGASAAEVDPDQHNPFRIISLYAGCGLLFLRISGWHEFLTTILGVNLGLLYLFGIPAVFGALLCGAVRRTFRARPAWYLMGYFVWVVAAIPTSAWPGGSSQIAANYLRTNIVMLAVVGGMAVTWKELRTLMRTLFFAAVATLIAASEFQGELIGGRMNVEGTSRGNANDFAAHVLFCLPFLYWVLISTKSQFMRLATLAAMFYALLLAFRTGSRGALVGLAALVVAHLIWGSARQRIGVFVMTPLILLSATIFVPQMVLDRLKGFVSGDEAISEAQYSAETRRYLLGKSIEYTLKFPIFGVGPGQFAFYEGSHNKFIGGEHGSWHETHNTLTQISAECGIPALLLMLAAMGLTFRMVLRVYRKSRNRPDCADINNIALALILSMAACAGSFIFLSLAYSVYEPIFVGMAIALSTTAEREMAARANASARRGAAVAIVPRPLVLKQRFSST